MRSKVSKGTRTYPTAKSPWPTPVDLWTLRRIANSLQDSSLPCIRSSDDEDSKIDICDSLAILSCSHSTEGLSEERPGKMMIRRWISLRLYVIVTCHMRMRTAAD